MHCFAFNTHFPRIHTYLVFCAGRLNVWLRMHLLAVISAISRQLHDEGPKDNFPSKLLFDFAP